MSHTEPKLVTKQEAARLLSVSTRTVDRMIADEQLPFVQVREQRRIPLTAIESLSNGGKMNEHDVKLIASAEPIDETAYARMIAGHVELCVEPNVDWPLNAIGQLLELIESGQPVPSGASTPEVVRSMLSDCALVTAILLDLTELIATRRERCLAMLGRIAQLTKKGS